MRERYGNDHTLKNIYIYIMKHNDLGWKEREKVIILYGKQSLRKIFTCLTLLSIMFNGGFHVITFF